MFEKVNPCHPDKVADRIAGRIVDIAYQRQENPRIAVEVLIGHGICTIIAETSVHFENNEIEEVVSSIVGENLTVNYCEVEQDIHLADNQKEEFRCGDNGIFKGVPVTYEENQLSEIVHFIYERYPSDGKYVLANDKLTICQSNAKEEDLRQFFPNAIINPLGEWTGGISVDSGATNRKLGSDMAGSVTGGGLHGKDLSKADVSVNIYCFLLAQKLNTEVKACCSIGDTEILFTYHNIDGVFKTMSVPFSDIVESARKYIQNIGSFEKFAEWGLI